MLPIGKRSAEYFAHHEAELFTREVLAADISVGQCFPAGAPDHRRVPAGAKVGRRKALLHLVRFHDDPDGSFHRGAAAGHGAHRAAKAEARRSQILYKPSSEEVFSAIIPEYVAGVVYGAVCEAWPASWLPAAPPWTLPPRTPER